MRTAKLIKILQHLGLTEKESKVYLACLELGSATIQEVADKAKIKRTSIYNFLEDLKSKGFITVIQKNKIQLLIAEDPNSLLAKVDAQKKKLEDILPEFLSIYNLPAEKSKVLFYDGIQGLKKVYEDTLKEKKTIYLISDYEKMFETMDEKWMWDYARKRASSNIEVFSIAKEGPNAKKAELVGKEQLREVRYVKKVEFETEINIFGDKVALLSFKRPYAGVIIEDRGISQTLLSMWKIIWEQAE
ncbi:TrmB family transcriptional regulator [Patescibacteria group bacterium]